MIKLGSIVQDRVTGLVGVAENRATFLYGCDRYCVQPQIGQDGKVPGALMIDEPQLEVSERPAVATEPPPPKQTIPLGCKVYDPIRGLSGTATGRAVYLNGCARILIEPKWNLWSADIEKWWTDEQQLVIKDKKAPVSEPVKADAEPQAARTGGPARSSSKY